MGYRVEPVVPVSEHLTAFATSAAAEGVHSGESLEQDMRELAAKRPELVEIKEIGRSLENRPILALRIGERKAGVRKLLFMGCHHAREWLAVEVPFLLARELIERADEAPIAGWLGNGEIWIAPMVNPDGHAFCRDHDRLWRKNRRPNPDGSFGSQSELRLHVGRAQYVEPCTQRRYLYRPAGLLRAGDESDPRPRRGREVCWADHLPQLLAVDPLSMGLHRRRDRRSRRPGGVERPRQGHGRRDQGRARRRVRPR